MSQFGNIPTSHCCILMNNCWRISGDTQPQTTQLYELLHDIVNENVIRPAILPIRAVDELLSSKVISPMSQFQIGGVTSFLKNSNFVFLMNRILIVSRCTQITTTLTNIEFLVLSFLSLSIQSTCKGKKTHSYMSPVNQAIKFICAMLNNNWFQVELCIIPHFLFCQSLGAYIRLIIDEK